jgi:ribosomal protein L40E
MILAIHGTEAQASLAVDTRYTAPDYLGQSMTVWVDVTNQASVPMQVQSLTVSFDWYSTLTGDVPRVLQAGEMSTWEFDNIQIPSETWVGEHSFDAKVMVGWTDSSGGWSHTLSSPLDVTTNFGVQSPPPPQGGFTEVGPGVPSYTVPIITNRAPDYSWVAWLILVPLILIGIVLGARALDKALSKPVQYKQLGAQLCVKCGATLTSGSKFCNECGAKQE